MTIFFMHRPKLLKLMLAVYLCTRMERLQKYFPIMNRPHGCLKKSHRCTPLKNFRLFLHSVIFFQLFSIQTFGYRETQKVPTVPKVSSVSSVPRYSSFSKAPKVALAPKARFAPRPPSPKFPPRVKRVTPPTRPKPTRLVPLVRRVPLVQRPKPVRSALKRLF